jgi:3-phosphoshikimate 1-carboxyvinyltransferase
MKLAHRISVAQPKLSGSITLEPSKSLSNRALIIQSLCKTSFEIDHLSTSDDTRVLQKMLSGDQHKMYAGHAGSSYRFMVALACLGNNEVTLEASPQLSRRPIGPLVRALQILGADITYLNKEGFPPLLIKPSQNFGKKTNELTLQAGISSQYISSLLMIAPVLPGGIVLHLTGDPVSVSYVQMTISMMEYFGIKANWIGNTYPGGTRRISIKKYFYRRRLVRGLLFLFTRGLIRIGNH